MEQTVTPVMVQNQLTLEREERVNFSLRTRVCASPYSNTPTETVSGSGCSSITVSRELISVCLSDASFLLRFALSFLPKSHVVCMVVIRAFASADHVTLG